MNRFFINLIIIITAFTNIQAQHPRVCDYVSLKHALKNREFEVMRSGPYQKDTMVVEHTKEEIRIGAINEYGKTIDSLNIINYKNDTVYIYKEFDISGEHDITEIKTHKGAFRINRNKNLDLEIKPFEIEHYINEDTRLNPTFEPSIYPDIFKWNGLEKLIKDKSVHHTADVWCTLTRLILNEYKLTHIDCWQSRIFMGSLKEKIALSKKIGEETDCPAEFEIVHTYDTISKKDNDEYISIMYEDENIQPDWFKKGSQAIYLGEYDKKKKYFLYEEPDTRSRKVYKFKEEVLVIYDIIGLWYYVKTTNAKGKNRYGWIKLQKEPVYLLNAEFYE